MLAILEAIVNQMNHFLWGYILVFALIVIGIYFTIRTNFVQFRLLGDMFRLLKEPAVKLHDESKAISPFKAFTISAASRIGTGNMAGIGIAIALGGPGAIFWMWVAALLGGATGFIESTLAQVYKQEDGEVNFKGGPSYYIQQHLNKRWLGIAFSFLVILTFGLIFNSVQSNTIAVAFNGSFGFDPMAVGIALVVLTALAITGGVTRIANITQIVVPVLALVYIGVAFYLIAINITEVPAMFGTIISSAFGMDQVVGGSIGGAILIGVKRGLFSNEAGMGSVPHAAATASISHPAKQGLIQALGVFIDTIFICSATAFMILLSNQYTQTDLSGIALLQASLNAELGSWAGIFISICIFLFAFSSVIGNYYYGESNIKFIRDNKMALNAYRLIVLGMVMFGALAKVELVWSLADISMGLMALINLIAIICLSKLAISVLNDYLSQRKAGKNPVFKSANVKGIRGKTYWD